MSWHPIPKDDAWKAVTLSHVHELGKRVWLRCNACGHDAYIAPNLFSAASSVPMETPLLLIGRRLRCMMCGERKGHCWPEPYSIGGETKRSP